MKIDKDKLKAVMDDLEKENLSDAMYWARVQSAMGVELDLIFDSIAENPELFEYVEKKRPHEFSGVSVNTYKTSEGDTCADLESGSVDVYVEVSKEEARVIIVDKINDNTFKAVIVASDSDDSEHT